MTAFYFLNSRSVYLERVKGDGIDRAASLIDFDPKANSKADLPIKCDINTDEEEFSRFAPVQAGCRCRVYPHTQPRAVQTFRSFMLIMMHHYQVHL
jgi:hypothetical protein